MNVGQLTKKYLEAAGCPTELLQSENLVGESPEYPCIVETANSSGIDLFISIHCNAANGEAHGTEVEVYDNTGGPAVELAKCMMDQICSSLGTTQRYINSRSGLAVLRATTMPAILVEMAFIDNADDEKLLAEKQDDFARAIARAVTDYEQHE
jgi:N-acetylmuramoyl-L-alanine amidase